MEKLFQWHLVCPFCSTAFVPEEDDWDDDIRCPGCLALSRIDHGDLEPDEDFEPPPGAHPDWPSNLSDVELDTAWNTRNILPQHLRMRLKHEYDKRERKAPTDRVGEA